MPNACLPYWTSDFAPMAQGPQVIVASGCSLGSDGNIQCDPESMRSNAEVQMRASGFGGSLSLEAYTLARYMHSEVGSGTIFERVAVGEAAVNRAKIEGLPNGVLDLLLYRQPQGHPNRGFYGPIHGIGTGVSTAPYGRWAATSRDPSLLTLLLAKLVADGKSGDYARGAQDQDGPEAWISQGQGSLDNYVRSLAQHGEYWVGPIPGIDHWHTFLQIRSTISPSSPEGQAMIQAGLDALRLPAQRPQWDLQTMPICGRPMGPWLWIVGIVSTMFGAWWFAHKQGR